MKEENQSWHPTYKELSQIIGNDNTMKLFHEYRGTQVAFPMRLVSRDWVKQLVKENYTTQTINQLAIRTGYSERNIRHLIKEIKTKDGGGEK